jgi:hypothetical protein
MKADVPGITAIPGAISRKTPIGEFGRHSIPNGILIPNATFDDEESVK